MSKIFAIGDIHGCYDQLLELLKKIPVDYKQDTLVFMGDYIDRGPKSVEVVDFLIKLKHRLPGTIFLKGNHEDMLQKYLDGTDRFTYLLNGGQQTLDSYLSRSTHTGAHPIPPDHMDFFKSLRLVYETDDYIFVHAGLRPKVPVDSQQTEDMLWIRDKFLYSRYDFGKPVIFGHTPLGEPLVESNKIGIDTGAVYGNELTCVQLPDRIFYTA
ncbi:MAG: metallophosphoesterase family protein [Desulfobacterales bacterium]